MKVITPTNENMPTLVSLRDKTFHLCVFILLASSVPYILGIWLIIINISYIRRWQIGKEKKNKNICLIYIYKHTKVGKIVINITLSLSVFGHSVEAVI